MTDVYPFVQGDCVSLFCSGGAGVWCRWKCKAGGHLDWRLDRGGGKGVFGTAWAREQVERLRGCLCFSSIQQHVDWLSFVWCFQVVFFLCGELWPEFISGGLRIGDLAKACENLKCLAWTGEVLLTISFFKSSSGYILCLVQAKGRNIIGWDRASVSARC